MMTEPGHTSFLPTDSDDAVLIGRLYLPAVGGPTVVVVRNGRVMDLSALASTVSELLDHPDLLDAVRTFEGGETWSLDELAQGSRAALSGRPYLLAPIDLQVIKAAGVTFAKSMVERVIEERAAGDATKALAIRERIDSAIGNAVNSVKPGSAEALEVKRILIAEGLWSQYLEVGIGPDPEIFTKAPVLSAVGPGADVGILRRSTWNNPEPELVLVVTSRGEPVGATLGNDVNLRDFEGRSALLLTEAKDNNASCALGPFIRLFDDRFTIQDARQLEIGLRIEGPDGFVLQEKSLVREMSRGFDELITHAFGTHHRYPDGFVLFTGTLFAPTQDRTEPGRGFTHLIGDRVTISAPQLGSLTNTVATAEDSPDWQFGIRDLMMNLSARSLLAPRPPVGGVK